ncbi:MAG: hypothetical protein D6732_03105 [Methanobacteriota archaeon]|nr:MAG: hypothetical protein D6732_03105 [Euryarchaeota archaeon]
MSDLPISTEKPYLIHFSAILVLLSLFNVRSYVADFKIGSPSELEYLEWLLLVSNILLLNDVAKRWFVLITNILSLISFYSLLLDIEEHLVMTSRSSSIALAYLLLSLAVIFQIIALFFGERITAKIFQMK